MRDIQRESGKERKSATCESLGERKRVCERKKGSECLVRVRLCACVVNVIKTLDVIYSIVRSRHQRFARVVRELQQQNPKPADAENPGKMPTLSKIDTWT